jgi:RimJ/RimL family protein N-acetyltransferase
VRPFPGSLRTERLTLRLPDDEEARVEHEMILESLDHLWPWFGFRANPPTLAERMELAARHRAQAAEGTSGTYILHSGDRPVGKAWLEVEGSIARLGWWLRASAVGHGYATEALRALAGLAFEGGITRLEAHTDPDNAPSRALAERAGFVLEEIRQDAYTRPDGLRRPECVYVLLKEASAGGWLRSGKSAMRNVTRRSPRRAEAGR